MLNKVQLIGNLGQKPEEVNFSNGGKIVKCSIATSEKWKDKNSGEQREKTSWHNLQFNGKLGDVVLSYLDKGSKIFIEGKIDYNKYTDKEGNEKQAVNINVRDMIMLDSKGNNGNTQDLNADKQPQAQADVKQSQEDDENSLPF